jgi:hypothetical protein
MEGSNRRVCSNGEWSGQRPVCFGLNQENDYARMLYQYDMYIAYTSLLLYFDSIFISPFLLYTS